MINAVVIEFIEESQPHGVFDLHTEHRRQVFAEVKSVTRTEFYQASNAGITPEAVFVLTDEADYHGEKVIEYAGHRWQVIRTYTIGQSLEITAGRATHDR